MDVVLLILYIAVLLAVPLAAWAVVRCRFHERKEDVDFPG